jgi:hypothetical protein
LKLAMEVGEGHVVEVDQPQAANPRARESQGGGTAQTARAHHQEPRRLEALLAGAAPVTENDLPAVALHLVV